MKDAEATRDGQAQASTDLDRFYARGAAAGLRGGAPHDAREAGAAGARRTTWRSRAAPPTPKTLRDSPLERLQVSYALTGDWDDIRQLIYEIETGPDFIVIDNVQLAEGAQANAPLSLTLEMSTYYRVAAMRLDRGS